jgi:hypothetical protein
MLYDRFPFQPCPLVLDWITTFVYEWLLPKFLLRFGMTKYKEAEGEGIIRQGKRSVSHPNNN